MNKEECVKSFKENIFDKIDFDCWVAGGCIRSFLTGENFSDVDLFFKNEEEFSKALNYFTGKNHKLILDNINCKKIYLIDETFTVDLVKRFYSSPEDCIKEFDFTVCCCAIDKERFYEHERFEKDLNDRKLVINTLPYPLSTLRRLQKYIKKGFSICNGGLLDIAKAISELDLSNPEQNMFEYYEDGTPKFVGID